MRYLKRETWGISIGWHVTGGPVVTFCKPIYYKIIKEISLSGLVFEEKSSTWQPCYTDIYSKASIFKGTDEIKLYPGVYAHGGFDFEYSHNDKLTQTIEIGSSISAYTNRIPIMAGENNKQVFFSLYASYRIGFILDPLKIRMIFLLHFLVLKGKKNNFKPVFVLSLIFCYFCKFVLLTI